MDGRVGAQNRISNYRLPSSIQPERRISAILTFNGIFLSLPNKFLLRIVLWAEKKTTRKGWKRKSSGWNFGTVESARLIFNLADEKLISRQKKRKLHLGKLSFLPSQSHLSRNCLCCEPRLRGKFICYKVSSSKKLYRWAKFRATSLRRQFYWPPDRGMPKGQMYAGQLLYIKLSVQSIFQRCVNCWIIWESFVVRLFELNMSDSSSLFDYGSSSIQHLRAPNFCLL